MKKIFCLIAAFIIITGCDDGDMSYKTFDFSNQEIPSACASNTEPNSTTEIYYKINGTEGLILQLAKGILENTPTGDGTPQEIVLGGSNTLTYQNYVSVPEGLCTLAEIPAVTETWIAQGTLSISTFEFPGGGEKLEGYTHQITLKNVTFKKGDETITINNSLFGNVEFLFDFDFDFTQEPATAPDVKQCPEGTLLYTRQGTEILSLNIADFDTVFADTSGTQNIAITAANADDYKILFNVYSSSVNDQNACSQGSEVPSLPVQKWQLIEGTLKIITTETGGIFSHDIYLQNAIFGSLINTGDTFILNEVIEVSPDGYFFGTY